MPIVLFIVVCLLIAGGWRAWRRSPLYSSRKTLQIGVVALSTVALIVGASVGLFSGPLRHSPAVAAGAGLLAIIVVSTAASLLLVRITDPPVAPLPSSAGILTTHRRHVIRWLGLVGASLLANVLAALLVPAAWTWLPLLLGGIVLVGCGPMLGALYMKARLVDLGMSAVIADPWIHWHYSSTEWASWVNIDRSRRRHRRLLAAPPETYLGAAGVYCNGEFTPWTLSGAFLVEARALRDPPARVQLTFQTYNGGSSRRVAMGMLIPSRRVDDLEILQTKLRLTCPTATVRLLDLTPGSA